MREAVKAKPAASSSRRAKYGRLDALIRSRLIPSRESPDPRVGARLVGMSYEPSDIELKQLLDNYIAQWNECDSERRGGLIRQVWAVDGVQVLVNPPQEIRETAAHYGIAHPPLEVHGHDAFDARVRRAYELYVEPGQYAFELSGEPVRQTGAAVSFTWVMRDRADGSVAGSGFDVLTFDADARIRTDHQFVA